MSAGGWAHAENSHPTFFASPLLSEQEDGREQGSGCGGYCYCGNKQAECSVPEFCIGR